jgi:ComF family protein
MASKGAAALGNALLNLAFPPYCAACSNSCGLDEYFCPACQDELALIEAPYCQTCGQPQLATETDIQCAHCRTNPPAYDQARALGLHQGPLARTVRSFKYYGKLSAGAALARYWAEQAPKRWLQGIDLAAPVPLHPLRLIKRGFNQSLLLCDRLPLPRVIPDLLIRRRHTKPQVGLGPRERRENVAQAFTVRPRYAELVDGARVALIDDVYTTGATVSECARELKYAGAAWVGVFTLMRAGRDPEPDESDETDQREKS